MTDKETHHEEHEHGEHGQGHIHFIETPPRNRTLGEILGIKEIITLIVFALTIGTSWANLSNKIQLLDQRQSYKETQLQESVENLTKEVKEQSEQYENILNRIRESEENIRRLWRQSR